MKKERIIPIQISENDRIQLLEICGRYDITVPQLLENFIADITNSKYSCGSDEREFARKYIKRCYYMPKMGHTTFRSWLAENYKYSLNDFYELIADLAGAEERITEYADDEEVKEDCEITIEYCRKEIEKIKTEYLTENPAADWEQEIQKLMEVIFFENKDKNLQQQ